jgi:hypothetical protein
LKEAENFRCVRYTNLLREHVAKVEQANSVFQRVAAVFENVSNREGQSHAKDSADFRNRIGRLARHRFRGRVLYVTQEALLQELAVEYNLMRKIKKYMEIPFSFKAIGMKSNSLNSA